MSDDDQVITVSTGVKFRLKEPNVWLLLEWDKKMDALAPEVPTTDREDGRKEENPASPTYQKAVARHIAMRAEKMYELAIASGTEVEYIPDGFESADGDEWTSVPKVLGVEIATNGIERKIQWVKYHACPKPEDMQLLLTPILKMSGTSEQEVQESLDRFRDQPGGAADKGNGDKQGGRHGHKTSTITRRTRAPVGGDASSKV